MVVEPYIHTLPRELAGRVGVELVEFDLALAEADVLCADPDTDASVLALARRDAGRLGPEQCDPKSLAALVRAGRQVVRIITRAPDVSTLRALAAEDVMVEVMLAAPGT